MTDRDLALALQQIADIEVTSRASMDGDEQIAAQVVVRCAVPLRLALERWLLLRATRAALVER